MIDITENFVKKVLIIMSKVPAIIQKTKLSKQNINTKINSTDFVTTTDKKIDTYLRKELKNIIPNAGFITEENTNKPNNTKYIGIIDPIDGTACYLNNLPFTCSVALEHNGEVIFGAILEIPENTFYFAIRGKGFYVLSIFDLLNRKDFSPFKHASLVNKDPFLPLIGKHNLLLTDTSAEFSDKFLQRMNVINDIKSNFIGVRVGGPCTLDILQIIKHRAALYIVFGAKSGDYSAAALMLEECGGAGFIYKNAIVLGTTDTVSELKNTFIESYDKWLAD